MFCFAIYISYSDIKSDFVEAQNFAELTCGSVKQTPNRVVNLSNRQLQN